MSLKLLVWLMLSACLCLLPQIDAAATSNLQSEQLQAHLCALDAKYCVGNVRSLIENGVTNVNVNDDDDDKNSNQEVVQNDHANNRRSSQVANDEDNVSGSRARRRPKIVKVKAGGKRTVRRTVKRGKGGKGYKRIGKVNHRARRSKRKNRNRRSRRNSKKRLIRAG